MSDARLIDLVAAAGYTVRFVVHSGDVAWVYIRWPQHNGQPMNTPGKRADRISGYTGQYGKTEDGHYLVVKVED